MTTHEKILHEVSRRFVCGTSFMPVMAAELEFYLCGDVSKKLLLKRIFEHCDIADEVEKEKGDQQYEVQFHPTADAVLLANTIARVRETISELSAQYSVKADFAAKPFPDQPGSGMHVHLSIQDVSGYNLFSKRGDSESMMLQHAVGGLLELMPASMVYFSPDEASYSRFAKASDAPTTLSWGGNNRTVALRLPTTTADPENRRIEHRVPAANSDPYMVLACVLAGAHYGIENKILPAVDKVYGNASDEQYHLPSLPRSLKEARACVHEYLEEAFMV